MSRPTSSWPLWSQTPSPNFPRSGLVLMTIGMDGTSVKRSHALVTAPPRWVTCRSLPGLNRLTARCPSMEKELLFLTLVDRLYSICYTLRYTRCCDWLASGRHNPPLRGLFTPCGAHSVATMMSKLLTPVRLKMGRPSEEGGSAFIVVDATRLTNASRKWRRWSSRKTVGAKSLTAGN